MHMDTSPLTQPRLLPVLGELKKLEPIFHTPAFGKTRAEYENFMDEGYWEVGASGNRYSRREVLDVLEKRGGIVVQPSWQTKDFCCRELTPGSYLLTYTLIQGERITRRSTLWRITNDGWKILYHQGTLVREP